MWLLNLFLHIHFSFSLISCCVVKLFMQPMACTFSVTTAFWLRIKWWFLSFLSTWWFQLFAYLVAPKCVVRLLKIRCSTSTTEILYIILYRVPIVRARRCGQDVIDCECTICQRHRCDSLTSARCVTTVSCDDRYETTLVLLRLSCNWPMYDLVVLS